MSLIEKAVLLHHFDVFEVSNSDHLSVQCREQTVRFLKAVLDENEDVLSEANRPLWKSI